MSGTIVLQTKDSWIQKTPGVCGGDACIRNTRITVWGLVEYRRLGMMDAAIRDAVQGLTPADLETAWAYAAAQPQEIAQVLWLNRAGMQDYPDGVPAWLLIQGRRLGLPDEDIREAFDPPLGQDVLNSAWAEYQNRPNEIERALRDHVEA